jgi:hypothetical protein
MYEYVCLVQMQGYFLIYLEEIILSNPKPYELCLLLYMIMMVIFKVSSVSSIKTELSLQSH